MLSPEISRAIEGVIEQAIREVIVLNCDQEAARLAASHPHAGATLPELSEALLEAAMRAGVPVQLKSPA